MIYIDTREPERILLELRKSGIEIEAKALPVGDYVIGNVVLERKSVNDLCTSTYSARIFKQLKNLGETEKQDLSPVLCVIGEFPPKTQWRRMGKRSVEVLLTQDERERKEKVVLSTLNTVLVSFPRVNILFLEKERHFLELLVDLHYRLTEHVPKIPVLAKKGKDLYEVVFGILTTIPGVGAKKATALMEKYSLEDLLTKDEKEFSKLLRGDSLKVFREAFKYRKEKK